jgi:hypothetical protein
MFRKEWMSASDSCESEASKDGREAESDNDSMSARGREGGKEGRRERKTRGGREEEERETGRHEREVHDVPCTPGIANALLSPQLRHDPDPSSWDVIQAHYAEYNALDSLYI